MRSRCIKFASQNLNYGYNPSKLVFNQEVELDLEPIEVADSEAQNSSTSINATFGLARVANGLLRCGVEENDWTSLIERSTYILDYWMLGHAPTGIFTGPLRVFLYWSFPALADWHLSSATALQSLKIACDTLLSGKAKVMLAGGFDDVLTSSWTWRLPAMPGLNMLWVANQQNCPTQPLAQE